MSQSEAERDIRRLIQEIYDLMGDSDGVAGLHLNGDIALWDSLLEGGEYSEWLETLSEMRKKYCATDSQQNAG